jgi:hypothetical protein
MNLTEIEARTARDRDNFGGSYVEQSVRDREALIALVKKQAAQLSRVEMLAEGWRYKGEFGWGAWQEGEGPDEDGLALDHAAAEIRAALEPTK